VFKCLLQFFIGLAPGGRFILILVQDMMRFHVLFVVAKNAFRNRNAKSGMCMNLLKKFRKGSVLKFAITSF
jgi:hypothetical protein